MSGPASTPSPATPRSPARPGHGRRWQLATPLLAFAAGWVALLAWRPLVTEPGGFLLPAFVIGLVVVLAGIGLRRVAVPAPAIATVQLALALLLLNLAVASSQSFLGVVPTFASVRRTAFLVGNGGAALNTFSSPVSVNVADTRAMLLACSLLVLLSVELLTTWLRRLPLVALPLLVTLSVPVSILSDGLSLPVFVGVALLFLRMLGTEELDRLGRWGRTSRPSNPGAARPAPDRALAGTLWSISAVAVVLAVVAAPLIPVSDLVPRGGSASGSGGGSAGGYQLTAVNPFIRLRRDLVEKTHTPLIYATTKAADTGYLRTTVLDQFTSQEWRPSARNLPASNTADGPFPDPPGLGTGVQGTEDDWEFELAPRFSTTWLPTPYPLRSVSIDGNWRYDSRTLDIAFVGGGAPRQISYSATSFSPDITAKLLESTISPPTRVRVANTGLPRDLPQVITDRAKEVTAGAKTEYAKAVALQNWFREGGGFTYSTEQRGGSGMDLLASFVTDDRVGYCEQFASAMAAMGRALDIPSRVVVGFLDGEEQPDGRILYTSDERHAWPEMYFSGVGWVRFEPTPGQRAGATPDWTRQESTTPAPTQAPSARPSTAPAPAPTTPDQGVDQQGTRFSVPWRPVGGIVLLLLLLVAPAVVRRVQRRRRLAGPGLHELSEGAWAELRATALDLGLDWPDHRSPREQARALADGAEADPAEVASLQGLLTRVEQGRYARSGADTLTADAEVRAQTLSTVSTWRRVLTARVERTRGWRGRLWPSSLVHRDRT